MFFDTDQFEQLFSLVTGLIALVFVAILGSWAYRALRYAAATTASAPARIVSKRMEVSGGGSGAGGVSSSASTRYYVTLEFDDGTRKELTVSGRRYGLLAEGDRGQARWRDVLLRDFARTAS